MVHPAAAGTMLNEIRVLAEFAGTLLAVDLSADPADNFLLAMAEAGNADYLVTGDGRHLLSLKRHRSTRNNGQRGRRGSRLACYVVQCCSGIAAG
jgi:predicted nucleic acid-binding protein